MLRPPHLTQDPPQIKAVESILDMDSDALAIEFQNFSFTPPLEKTIYASSNSDPVQINFETLFTLKRDQIDIEIKSVRLAFDNLATSVQKSKINEIKVITKAIPVQVERLYEDLNNKIKKLLNEDKYKTLNTDPLAQIFIRENPDNITKAIEALATPENPKKNIDKAKLLIYGQLIDKIEEIDSNEIKKIYDKILHLKFKEVTLKKFLPPKEKTPARIKAKPSITEMPLSYTPPISQPIEPSPLSILLKTPAKEIKETHLQSSAYPENKILEPSPEQVKFEREITDLESEINQIKKKLIENSKSSNKKREYIENKIKEILSPEYVEEKQKEDTEKSIMDQLLIEAIIIDEAKKILDQETFQNLKNSHSNNLEILNKAFSIQKPQDTPAFSLSAPYIPGGDLIQYQTTIDSDSSREAFYKSDHELNSNYKEFKKLKTESKILEATLEELNETLKDKTQNRPLPPEVAKLAQTYERENWRKKILEANKARVISEYKKLENESNLLKKELSQLEEIKKQDQVVSDSIPMPNLQEIIAREEELTRVLEEKQRQENITRIEAWKIQQELQIQEALNRRQRGEIKGLRPGQQPTIFPNQTEFKAADFTPKSTSGVNELTQSLRMETYLAGLRGGEPSVIEAQQKAAPDSLQSQEPYSSFQTLSGLQNLGAKPFALELRNTEPQAPVQDSSSNNQPLAPTQTSLQDLQANAKNTAQEVASPRNIPAGTSAIFMLARNANILTNENPENPQNHSPPSHTELDKLLQALSENKDTLYAEQPLSGLESYDLEQVQDLTNLHQSREEEHQILELQQNHPEFIYSTLIEEELPQNIEQTREKQSDVPPPPSRDEFQASIIPSLNLDKVEQNIPPTILRTQEEKKQFWQTFISTRLRERPSNSNQNSPRNNEDDSNQDQLYTRSQPSSPALELEDSDRSSTFRSISSCSKEEDEIEIRKIGLYAILDTILKTNLEKQNTTEFDSPSIDEEEIDVKTAENNIEFVITQIATLTLDLASSISKDENKQTGATHQSEASDPQTTQNSSNEDPIIYSGIGIRIKLENENGEYFLRITEIFENSGLHKTNDVNKKITHVEYQGELKSISDIHNECGGDEEKFYTKIALIFRDGKQEKLTLKIEGEEQGRTVEKNFFIPEDKTVLNVTNNSQMTKIAEKLRGSRQISRQLTPRGELTITT